MKKRSISPDSTLRRVKPTLVNMGRLKITNLDDGEVVHQTCVVVSGECPHLDASAETYFVSVSCSDGLSQADNVQNWPINKGNWKALIMLSPGTNKLIFNLHHAGEVSGTVEMKVTYQPLLQLPPLHLAILVAKDSPLLMDCPPAKYGGISTAHSSIEAAISKLRMSAYMWQALTAEDMRQKGLGRRSFRLEEEWAPNSTMQKAYQHTAGVAGAHMGCVAKVHMIRSEKTVAELRDAEFAQQNPHAENRDALHQFFESALQAHGPPFDSSCYPVVAGMILDSHYDVGQDLILGHAALGCHKPDGISLGIFGSHLTYSWPRFLEEIPASLVDLTPTGNTVGNDNGECSTMRGACFVGQGAFLHEVGHAFGADHTTGIMARGYSEHWDRNFLGYDADSQVENEARWDLKDVLKFKLLPHFKLPGDHPVTKDFKNAIVRIEAHSTDEDDEHCIKDSLKVSCGAGLAKITAQSGDGEELVLLSMDAALDTPEHYIIDSLRDRFDEEKSLTICAIGMNGKERKVGDAWKLLYHGTSYIRIPGSNVRLRKQSARSAGLDEANTEFMSWAFLLRERGKDGQLHRATSIDLRVGATMDGAVVYYADGHHTNCGPMRNRHNTAPHYFGGHASEKRDIPENATISTVEIETEGGGWCSLAGIRMTLSNGQTWGHLNSSEEGESVVVLEPLGGEVIVGFFGQSEVHSGFTHEFGILTAPEGVELPEQVYNMEELKHV